MPLDEEVAQRLRYLKTPVILVMNKADYPEIDQRGGEFYKLGRGKPIAGLHPAEPQPQGTCSS